MERAETREAVVVGGGIAGLAAAWRLRERDVVLLEASDRLGGRLRSERRGAYWMNLGAHLFPAPGSLVDAMARECGLETVPVTGSMMGLAVGSHLVNGGRVESYPFRLPLSVRERAAFAVSGLRVKRAVDRRARLAKPAPGERPVDVRARVLGFEDHRTFAEFLGDVPPAVSSIFSCAVHRATAEPDELSAGCGIGLFALVWSGRDSLIARNLLGGTEALPAALGRRLGDRVRTGCRVTDVRPDGTHLIVEHAGGRVHARHVIIAVQAPHAASLVAAVAPETSTALAQITYGAFVCVAVETREAGPMPYDRVYAMATPGRVFDLFTNQAQALRHRRERRPGGSLMLFAGGHAAAALSRASDEEIVRRFLDDLHDLYPQTRGAVADAIVQRWALGNAFARPGRHRLQPALEGPLGADRNLHLAGDYFAELGNMEAAARTGAAAAERVEAQLRDPAIQPAPSPIEVPRA
jgi:oxygen-dependent protoporphyrinogen oxidase